MNWIRGLWLSVLLSILPTFGASASELPEVEGFPDHPIRIVVYTSPGGLIDVTARRFARVASKYYQDHPFVVINRPGGGGIVAFENVIQSPPDGHNVLAVTRSNITKLVETGNQHLIEQVDWHSYIMDNPHVLITNTSDGFRNWEDIYEHGVSAGNEQLWLGAAVGGVKHISGVKIAGKAGISMRWIPYSSGGEAQAALIGNLGHLYLGNPRDALASQDLAIAAVAAPERMERFPESPTFTELGIDGLEGELIWRGLALREGTPEPIREWFATLVQKVTSDPEWIDAWEGEAVNLVHRDADAFHEVVQSDIEEFEFYLAEAGLLREETAPNLLQRIGSMPGILYVSLALALILAGACYGLLRTGFRQHTGELILLLSGFALVLIAWLMTTPLPPASAIDPISAAGVPRLWLYALIPLLAYQLYLRFRHHDEEGGGGVPLHLMKSILLMGGYILTMPWAGYLITSLLYMPAALLLLGLRRPVLISILTLGWLVFSELVFRQVLYVDLPTGRLLG